MVSLLESYEKQYGNLTSDITAKLNNIPRLANDERKAEIVATTRLFDETRELLEQMDLEIQDMAADVKPKYSTRLQCYGQELARLAQEFKRPRYSINVTPSTGHLSDHNALREELLNDAAADSGDMRASLLTNTERVERTGRRLNEGLRVAYETEDIGGQILTDLDQQRETIQRSRDRLRHTNEDLSRSSRLISKMYRRVIQNRAALVAIAVLMCLVFFGAIYIMLFRNSDKPVTNQHSDTSLTPPSPSIKNSSTPF